MKVNESPPLHLTYCLNLHPGETWAENRDAIQRHALVIRERVCGDRSFGLGLRLGARAARELAEPGARAEFRRFLAEHDLYVFTVNGFPYGAFHGAPVKRDVYRPDWRDESRLRYTKELADILADLLPEGVGGSISTVPGGYKAWCVGSEGIARITANLAAAAEHFASLRRRTGKDICLALEPEPDCFLETADEAAAFLSGPMVEQGSGLLSASGFMCRSDAEDVIRRHVGVCLDTCHAAVQFEDPVDDIRRYAAVGVRIGKIQLSAALQIASGAPPLDRLRGFCNATYLHQVRVRRPGGRIAAYADLADLMDGAVGVAADVGEWRIHLHVPLYFEGDGILGTTAAGMTREFFGMLKKGVSAHLEIETYTFGVLPATARCASVEESVTREFMWVLKRLGDPGV